MITNLLIKNILTEANCDYARPWQYGFQDPASPIMEGIIDLHHDIMFFLTLICIFVLYMLVRTMMIFHPTNKNYAKYVHGTLIEIVWTITPSFVLAIIAIPSFALLYSIDEIIDPALTLKVVGHQWYWSYEYSDYKINGNDSIAFDSYMTPDDELKPGELRLLEVDNPIFLPINTHIRVLITSDDVLHSWAIPSLGVKLDACPGRLNQTALFLNRAGTFYGQCSELCGINHGFMPICIQGITIGEYGQWLTSHYSEEF